MDEQAATLDGRKRELEAAAGPVACFSCGRGDVKYRCPRCERVTCSLACCLAHKKQLDCDGKRDRTKYIQVKSFTDADLSSDYFFLEEVSRSTNTATRARGQLGVNVRHFGPRNAPNGSAGAAAKKRRVNGTGESVNPDVPSDWLARFPVATQLLAQHAVKRGVALTLLAPGMSKRTRNTSYMDVKNKVLLWRVEWDFPFADVQINLCENRAADSQTLFAMLEKYLTQNPENVTIRSKLKRYTARDWQQHVTLLLRKEFVPASQPQFYRLDGNQSLESNLKRKAVVEFPIIAVVPNSEVSQYPIAFDAIEVVGGTDDVSDPIDGSSNDTEETTSMPIEMKPGGEQNYDSTEKTSDAVDECEMGVPVEDVKELAGPADPIVVDDTLSPM